MRLNSQRPCPARHSSGGGGLGRPVRVCSGTGLSPSRQSPHRTAPHPPAQPTSACTPISKEMRKMDPQNQDCNSYFIAQQQSRNSILTEWIGMGKSGPQNLAKRRLWNSMCFMMVLLSLLLRPACCQQCRIQRCNAEYVASTSPSSGLQDDAPADVDYCIALRAYSLCTRRMARSCRGDLFYHSAVFRIKELFTQHNCSSDGPTSSARASGAAATPRPPVPELCDYESRAAASASGGSAAAGGPHRKYAHCGLFGDPHLRTFRDEFQTCKVEGAWPLIDNRYLSVQVTNVPVVQGSSATATSKITVIFKAFRGCTEQKVYQATTDDLPSAFQDGTRSGGQGGSLWIAPAAPPRPAYTVERATARCRETLQVEDVYFQSCVFDLLTTGDPEFSMAAFGALEDLKALPPSRLKQSSSPRTPPLPRGSAPGSAPSLLALLALLLLLL